MTNLISFPRTRKSPFSGSAHDCLREWSDSTGYRIRTARDLTTVENKFLPPGPNRHLSLFLSQCRPVIDLVLQKDALPVYTVYLFPVIFVGNNDAQYEATDFYRNIDCTWKNRNAYSALHERCIQLSNLATATDSMPIQSIPETHWIAKLEVCQHSPF